MGIIKKILGGSEDAYYKSLFHSSQGQYDLAAKDLKLIVDNLNGLKNGLKREANEMDKAVLEFEYAIEALNNRDDKKFAKFATDAFLRVTFCNEYFKNSSDIRTIRDLFNNFKLKKYK